MSYFCLHMLAHKSMTECIVRDKFLWLPYSINTIYPITLTLESISYTLYPIDYISYIIPHTSYLLPHTSYLIPRTSYSTSNPQIFALGYICLNFMERLARWLSKRKYIWYGFSGSLRSFVHWLWQLEFSGGNKFVWRKKRCLGERNKFRLFYCRLVTLQAIFGGLGHW